MARLGVTPPGRFPPLSRPRSFGGGIERSPIIMLRRLAALATAVLLVAACGVGSAAPSASLVSIGAGLTGPVGLKATVYATGLSKVAALSFDSEGRLWAATADYTDAGKDGVYVV